MSAEKVLVGVLSGVAIGVTLGVLFAPDKGSATRKKIVTKSQDYVHDLEGRLSEATSALTRKVESMAHDSLEAVENGARRLEERKTI